MTAELGADLLDRWPPASGVIPEDHLGKLPADDDPGGYVRRVVRMMRDAALALQAVHERQLVHRDVKPANLMLTPDGARVVLMDFGLAKGRSLATSATRGGGLLGTLRYAAPEQLAAATLEVGPPADVRSSRLSGRAPMRPNTATGLPLSSTARSRSIPSETLRA